MAASPGNEEHLRRNVWVSRTYGSVDVLALLFVLFMLSCSISAPYFETTRNIALYHATNYVPSHTCNQYPTHSFEIFGTNMALCARCEFVYVGVLVAYVFRFVLDPRAGVGRSLFLSAILIVPLAIDGLTQYYHYRTSTNALRSLTGFLAGLGLHSFLYFLRASTDAIFAPTSK